ncbi:glycosyltransferase family 2 protein [Agrobacterium rubi]|nr:glycosyltransferase family 2 protein [Agrobacterium rubi]NTF24666.1 glycosyltransferase family 2 protein [Agrobacterium rubi]
MKPPFITIVIPTLNEQDYIIGTLVELSASAEGFEHEIIVADGGSTDDTRRLVRDYAERHAQPIRLIDNPARLQAAAVNLAAREADPRATILLRADAHCAYPPGFVSVTVTALLTMEAQSVVVPMIATEDKGAGTYQEAVALAQNSRLGNGGSSHRDGRAGSAFVDHGHHAAFDIGFFRELGGYDESFITNEDAEYDARVIAAGGRIWMIRAGEIQYFPRSSPGKLARQYFGYGRGRCATIIKHRMQPKPRQMAPLAIFLVMALSLLSLPLCVFSLATVLGYVGLTLVYALGISGSRTSRSATAFKTCSALMIMHNAWGAGFMAGLVGHFAIRKGVSGT